MYFSCVCYEVYQQWIKLMTINYGNTSRRSCGSTTCTSSQEQNVSFPNEQWSNFEVATQASGNTKLCLTIFWQKITVSRPYINNFFFHYCNKHRQLQCNYHLILLTTLPVNPDAITQLTRSCLYTEWKKASFKLCNCLVLQLKLSIHYMIHYNCFHRVVCFHFENLNVHFVSHHILIIFVSTQWSYIFHKL